MSVELGSGLISIGREWGYKKSGIPSSDEALSFLRFAFDSGVSYFDTAPAYGTSEKRLGKWLSTLTQEERDRITIATKCGEFFVENGETYVDHSYQALKEGIDNSLRLLGRIDVLQLHKTTPHVLESDDVKKAWEYAKSLGIDKIGASVSDDESLHIVSQDPTYGIIQAPLNKGNTKLLDGIVFAQENGKIVVINRPFNMGEAVHGLSDNEKFKAMVSSYKFIQDKVKNGIVLTGTKSTEHLRENIEAFLTALEE